MLTKEKINFRSNYSRKDGDILNKQQILGDFHEELKAIQKEIYKYSEEPPYLKRQLAELQLKIEKRINKKQ